MTSKLLSLYIFFFLLIGCKNTNEKEKKSPRIKSSIKIKSPIRTIGNYKITTHFFEDISAEITVSVVPDELSEVITTEPDKTTEDIEVSDPTFEDVLKETDTSSSDLETDNNKDTNEQNTSEITEEIIVESENDNKSSNMEEKNISSDNENTK